MGSIVEALHSEFSDLSLVHATQLVFRLLIAGLVGGLLGWEREAAGKAAGFRTHILVAVGSAAFVAVPQQAGMSMDALRAVIQGLVAGIGFLGAGCILKSETEGRIRGLTTAASLWLTTAVGAAAGMGRDASALLIGAIGLFALTVLRHWEVAAQGRKNGNGEPPESS